MREGTEGEVRTLLPRTSALRPASSGPRRAAPRPDRPCRPAAAEQGTTRGLTATHPTMSVTLQSLPISEPAEPVGTGSSCAQNAEGQRETMVGAEITSLPSELHGNADVTSW